jgi:hypothetical protein
MNSIGSALIRYNKCIEKKRDHAEADPFLNLFIFSNLSYSAGSGVGRI